VTHRQTATRVHALLLLLACLQACSLLSIKSPEKPLPQRDLNARMLTRDYAARFSDAVARAADAIAANTSDISRQENTVRWKLSSGAASREAATQMAPMIALLDSWALSAQMRQFFGEDGAGAQIFGDQQAGARDTAEALEKDAQRMAESVTTKSEFASYSQFVAAYVRDYPLGGIDFKRASVLNLWVTQTHQESTLLATLGTVPEALGDFADRNRLYSGQLPEEAVWRTQLAIRQSDLRAMFVQMDSRLAGIAKLAETSPQMVHGVVADLRVNLLELAGRFDQSWLQLVQSLHDERVALSGEVREERIELTAAADLQRAAIMKDADQTATRLTEAAWDHLRTQIRELLIFGLLAVIILLSMPFAAGYYLGRARRSAPGEQVS
jgi:hypothetical protein